MLLSPYDRDILTACRTLFGPAITISPQFLLSLEPAVVKSVFRKKAKETHPDLFAGDPLFQQRQAELFRVVNDAYRIMREYCERRDRRRPSPMSRAEHPARPKPAPEQRREERKENRHEQRQEAEKARQHEREPFLILPRHRLEIGRFLYHSGRIPYRDLINALVWQRRQRPPFGTIAQRWGWLTEETIDRITSLRGGPYRFGDRALRLGLLTDYQMRLILAYQRTLHRPLGEYFVDQGLLSKEDIERIVADLHRHNSRFSTGEPRR